MRGDVTKGAHSALKICFQRCSFPPHHSWFIFCSAFSASCFCALAAGFGYTVTVNRLGSLGDSAPSNDGLWLMDMFTGKAQLMLSLQQLGKLQSDSIATTETLQAGSPSQPCYHWLSKPQVKAQVCRCSKSETCLTMFIWVCPACHPLTHPVCNQWWWVVKAARLCTSTVPLK